MTSVEIFFGLTVMLFVVWGLFMAFLARRLGRVPFAWWLVGTALGPLSIVPFLAVGRNAPHRSSSGRRRRSEPRAATSSATGCGPEMKAADEEPQSMAEVASHRSAD